MISDLILNYVLKQGFICQVVATTLTYCTLRVLFFYKKRHSRYQLLNYYGIPGPVPSLFQGNLGAYVAQTLSSEVDERLRNTYGETYGVYIGDEPTIVVTNVDILKKIFLYENESFQGRSQVFIESPLAKGLLFAVHHRWKIMRKIMTPAFNRYKVRGGTSTEFVEESIKLMLEYIEQKRLQSKSSGVELTLEIQSLMKATALHLISSLAVKLPGVQVKEHESYVRDLDKFFETASNGVVLWAIRFPFIKSIFEFIANNFEYDRTLGTIRRTIDGMVAEARKSPEAIDRGETASVVDILIDLHLRDKITRDELIGNVETILLAGYDTTSTTLTYAFWVLSKYQDVQQKLREELIAHGVCSIYLEQVIFETMRLYPTVVSFITRLVTKTVTIDGLTLPQGSRVMLNNWLLHRSPSLWKDPLRFDPNRFDSNVEIHPCAFAPFGLGNRKCLGYKLAMLEMKMVLCDLVLRYKFTLVGPTDLKLKSHGVVLTMPSENVVLKLEKI